MRTNTDEEERKGGNIEIYRRRRKKKNDKERTRYREERKGYVVLSNYLLIAENTHQHIYNFEIDLKKRNLNNSAHFCTNLNTSILSRFPTSFFFSFVFFFF